MLKMMSTALLGLLLIVGVAFASESKVHFLSPKEGATIATKSKVVFSVDGMKVEKAGAVKAGEGHHHLLVDTGAIPKGQVVPKDATHLHYGNAQTEGEVELTPGKHTLTLQFADGAHVSYGPEFSTTINVIAK